MCRADRPAAGDWAAPPRRKSGQSPGPNTTTNNNNDDNNNNNDTTNNDNNDHDNDTAWPLCLAGAGWPGAELSGLALSHRGTGGTTSAGETLMSSC